MTTPPEAPSPAPPTFRIRLGLWSRLYVAFLALVALLCTPIVPYMVACCWSVMAGDTFRWALLAIALGAPVAAWFLCRALVTGLSPFPVPDARGPIAELLWRAARGDPAAASVLHGQRMWLRATLGEELAADPGAAPRFRGPYSLTITHAERLLKEIRPESVIVLGGTPEDKRRVVDRLESELLTWRADLIWFERRLEELEGGVG